VPAKEPKPVDLGSAQDVPVSGYVAAAPSLSALM